MNVTVENLVQTINGLDEKFKYFHLSQCVCGAPMWQQPCTICGFYPMYDFPIEAKKIVYGYCTKEMFIRNVNHRGNILEFYLHSFMKCLDPQTWILNEARRKTQGWTWPLPEEIWDYFRNEQENSKNI